jgi:hypothetical protein
MNKMREAFELWYETTTESEDDLTYHEWMWRSWQAATSPLLDKNEKCETCNGHGMIGGFVRTGSGEGGYDGEPCPACTPLDKNDQAEGEVPIGYIDREQLSHWEKLRGTKYARACIGFSTQPFKSELSDYTLPIYTNSQPPQPDSNELVELRRDAERYRWIRNNAGFNLGNDYNIGNFQVSQKIKNGEAWYYYEEKLDEIIDTSLAKSPSAK